MINVEKIKPTGLFTNYIYKAIPLAFDESMGYYETLCGLLSYLKNTVIPALNNNANAIIEVQNLMTELQNYVNNYFDNLDVQDEINNKLDEMVTDGTLQTILQNYTSIQKIYATHQEMIEDTTLLNNSKCKTIGYYSINDGGGANYVITDTIPQSMYYETLENGLYAILLLDNNLLNVKQIGAKGDNETNDTTIIQSALNNFNNIYFPSGTYLIDILTLNNKNNYNIYGENNNNTIIKCINANIDNEFFTFIDIRNCESIKFHDLTVNGNKVYGNTPLSFVDSNNIEIYNNIVKNGASQRLINVQTFSADYGINTKIYNNKLYNSGYIRSGAMIECTGSHETIEDVEVRYYLKNLEICNNYCEVKNSTYVGDSDLYDCIEIDNTIGCLIQGNYCDNELHIGISVDTVNIDFKVIDNYCINAITHGINVTGAYGLTQGIIANNIIKNTRQGIGINNENITVTGNQIYNSSVRAIVLLDLAKYCVISNNLIDTAPQGIYVGGLTSDTMISNNKFRNISSSNSSIVVPDGTGNHLSLNFDNNDVTITSLSRVQEINGILIGRQPSTVDTLYFAGSNLRFKDYNNNIKEVTTTAVE